MWNFNSNNDLPEGWSEVKSLEDLESAIDRSHTQAIALFKHSTRCSRSAFAKHRLEEDFEKDGDLLPIYYLDLLAHRNISDRIASTLGVMHQSPQLIIVRNGRVVHHASHEAIDLSKALASSK